MFGLFVCRPEHVDERGRSSGPHRRENAPGWPIIIGFTIVFLSTYPLHMYVSEVYLADSGSSFAFVMAKVSISISATISFKISTIYLTDVISISTICRFFFIVLHRIPVRHICSDCYSVPSKGDTNRTCYGIRKRSDVCAASRDKKVKHSGSKC